MYEDSGDENEWLSTDTDDLKLLHDYTGLNFEHLLNLDCYTYRKLLINAFIDKMKQSNEGREYLEKAWYLQQTDMDVDKVRKIVGGVNK